MRSQVGPTGTSNNGSGSFDFDLCEYGGSFGLGLCGDGAVVGDDFVFLVDRGFSRLLGRVLFDSEVKHACGQHSSSDFLQHATAATKINRCRTRSRILFLKELKE